MGDGGVSSDCLFSFSKCSCHRNKGGDTWQLSDQGERLPQIGRLLINGSIAKEFKKLSPV